jgi:hypothetical protein
LPKDGQLRDGRLKDGRLKASPLLCSLLPKHAVFYAGFTNVDNPVKNYTLLPMLELQ